MTRLIPGVFGEEFRGVQKPLFGIHCGQWRTPSVVHNGGWYNHKGEKLGFGDLSEKDVERIAKQLKENEMFIVLGERDSFWNFVTGHAIIGSLCPREEKEKNPGQEYVAEKARFVITKDSIKYVDQDFGKRDIGSAELLQLMQSIKE